MPRDNSLALPLVLGVIGAGVFALILLFGYYVWPTPWERVKSGRWEYRVHRVNGTVEWLAEDGWHTGPTPDSIIWR